MKIQEGFRSVRRLAAIGIVTWTVIIGISLGWNVYNEHHQTHELITKEARAHFNKDQAFRLWATKHGGVYVPTDARTLPNPWLEHVPERDIQTPSGQKLTLMNPAYMLRQMMDEYAELYGVKGRITSLKQFNPSNAPDEWEKRALLAFEKGEEEVLEITDIDGAPHLRLMRPMLITEGCLKCHSVQGYKLGDIRGGVGVSVPMVPYLILERWHNTVQFGSHITIWLIGLLTIGLIVRRSRYRHIERLNAEEALEKKSKKLELANDELQQFAYAAAHDLQEPLRTVVNHTQLIKQQYKGKMNEEADRSIESIVAAARNMHSKVVDMQAYLEISEKRAAFKNIDTNVLLADVLKNIDDEIRQKDAVVSSEELPTVYADYVYLAQVFRHLIANGLKYQRSGNSPKVKIAAERKGDEWIFSVADNGIGIAPEYRERIFGVFRRLHPQNKYSGTGMGLAMCKKIIEKHDGRMWVESDLGMGCRFFFSLPSGKSIGQDRR